MEGIRVSRTRTGDLNVTNPISIGASYTWVSSLKDAVGPDTQRIVMYHARLRTLEGLERSRLIHHAYLGFNLIEKFRPEDKLITGIQILDLVGNPIESLENAPPVKELIVSSTRIKNLKGCPDTVEILRAGHSTFLESLDGLPDSVKILEINCAPNVRFTDADLGNLKELHAGGEVFLFE